MSGEIALVSSKLREKSHSWRLEKSGLVFKGVSCRVSMFSGNRNPSGISPPVTKRT